MPFSENLISEAKAFALVALPTLVWNLCKQSMGLTDISFLGHLRDPDGESQVAINVSNTSTSAVPAAGLSSSTRYLAASSMATTWISMSMVAIFQGLSASVVMLGSTALGAGNPTLAGLYLQLGIVAVTLACVPIGLSWFFAGGIMRFVVGRATVDDRLEPLIARFARVMLVGILPASWFSVVRSWLTAQSIVYPIAVAGMLLAGVNVALNQVYIYVLGFGFPGSPAATSTSNWLLLLTGVVTIRAWGVHRKTLPRFNFGAALSSARVREYWAQSWPMALSGLLEEAQLQVVAVFAGRLGQKETATHNGIFTIFWFLSSFMWALSAATKVRMAWHLGRGDIAGAQRVGKICLALGAGVGVAVAATFGFGSNQVAKVFSDDPAVWKLTSNIAVLVGGGYAVMSIFYACMATLQAQGRPAAIAVAFVMGGWVVCIPCAYCFAFVVPATKGLFGLWVGMVCGYFVVTMISVAAVLKSDWPAIVVAARARAEAEEDDAAGGGGGGLGAKLLHDPNSGGGGSPQPVAATDDDGGASLEAGDEEEEPPC